MRNVYKLTCFYLVTLAGFCSTKASTPILEYTLARRDSISLFVTLAFTGDSSGTTTLMLPNEWAGQQKLYAAVSSLQAASKNTTIQPTDTPWQYHVIHPPHAKVIISYVLTKNWPGPLQYPKYFNPVILPDYFYFEGYSGLVYPAIDDTVSLRCKITYKGLAGSLFTGNSFFSGATGKSFSATLANLLNGVYCAGNYRFKKLTLHNNTLVIALHGNFLFKDGDVYNAVSNIIQYERDFWSDNAYPYFFTVLHAMDDNNNSGGTAHHNSFAMFQSASMPFSRDLTWLISHEYFHTWLGQHLKMPAPDELYKWFSEGFTDYYAYKILKLTGNISEKDYYAKLNQIIQSYYLSPYFNTLNTAIIGNYWSNGDLKQLSYQRGLVIAFLLENSITGNGHSLGAMLKGIYHQSAPSYIFSPPMFDSLVREFSGDETIAAIDSVNNGNNTALTALLTKLLKPGMQTITVDKVFDIGFNFNQSMQAHKITGLEKGSNAEKAGLTEGEECTGNVSIWNNDTEKPAKIQVMVDGKKQWIEYIPAKQCDIKLPQMVIE